MKQQQGKERERGHRQRFNTPWALREISFSFGKNSKINGPLWFPFLDHRHTNLSVIQLASSTTDKIFMSKVTDHFIFYRTLNEQMNWTFHQTSETCSRCQTNEFHFRPATENYSSASIQKMNGQKSLKRKSSKKGPILAHFLFSSLFFWFKNKAASSQESPKRRGLAAILVLDHWTSPLLVLGPSFLFVPVQRCASAEARACVPHLFSTKFFQLPTKHSLPRIFHLTSPAHTVAIHLKTLAAPRPFATRWAVSSLTEKKYLQLTGEFRKFISTQQHSAVHPTPINRPIIRWKRSHCLQAAILFRSIIR